MRCAHCICLGGIEAAPQSGINLTQNNSDFRSDRAQCCYAACADVSLSLSRPLSLTLTHYALAHWLRLSVASVYVNVCVCVRV